MPVDDTATPADPALPVGRRIRLARERRGLTRAVLAGLLGKSESWLKRVELGQLQSPRLPTLLKVAEILKVADLSDLTGTHGTVETAALITVGHPALPAVRRAIVTAPLVPDGPPPDLAHLRARLDLAWRIRHTSPRHRTALAELLPALITDATAATRQHTNGSRQPAYGILAEVMNLSQMFVAYQPDPTLLWRVAERGLMAAQESGEPATIAAAVWFLGQAHRDAGQWDEATAVVDDALAMLETRLPDADTESISMYGALCFEAAYTAARMGEAGLAWRMWDRAEQTAARLPADHYHRQTSFSRVIIGAHAVTAAVELQTPGEAARFARRTSAAAIPSAPRRGRHLIEVARAEAARGNDEAVLSTLQAAQESAPETLRYNGYGRRMVLDLLEGPRALRRPAGDLARAVGLLD